MLQVANYNLIFHSFCNEVSPLSYNSWHFVLHKAVLTETPASTVHSTQAFTWAASRPMSRKAGET